MGLGCRDGMASFAPHPSKEDIAVLTDIFNAEPPAVHLSDWSFSDLIWVTVLVGVAAAVLAGSFAAGRAAVWIGWDWPTWARVAGVGVLVIAGVIAVVVVIAIPSELMRHLPTMVLVKAVGFGLAVIGVIGLGVQWREGHLGRAGPALVATSGLLSLATEAVTRELAAIPMSWPMLGLIVVAALWVGIAVAVRR